MSKIITIGREFGSGGRELGRRMAENLGFAYYDREIITEIASRTQLSEEYVKSIIERRPIISFPIHMGRSFCSVTNQIVLQEQKIYQEQRSIIREISEKSDCVIVGRCADYILRDKKPFRVFVYADMDSKIERCQKKGHEREQLSEKELKQRISEIDRHRAQYYNFYTGQKWGDRKNYDMCINTTYADIKKAATAMTGFFIETYN